MSKSVFVVDGDYQVELMFRNRGWALSTQATQANLICFTGGVDVSPELYGATKHPTTMCSPYRDKIEKAVYEMAHSMCIPMVGICRGGQFLNVMNGGKMWQDVNNHGISHFLTDVLTSERIYVTSTHHQMMIPAEIPKGSNNVPIIVAVANESSRRETDTEIHESPNYFNDDIEVLYYPDSECLCFQPHPEYKIPTCTDYFFELIERFNLGDD